MIQLNLGFELGFIFIFYSNNTIYKQNDICYFITKLVLSPPYIKLWNLLTPFNYDYGEAKPRSKNFMIRSNEEKMNV